MQFSACFNICINLIYLIFPFELISSPYNKKQMGAVQEHIAVVRAEGGGPPMLLIQSQNILQS